MVVTALQNLNNPFIAGASMAGTKWVTSEVAARGMKILQRTNASGTLYSSAPSGQSSLTVTLLQSSGTATRNVSITPQSYQYTDFSGASQTISYSDAHWDIELALMNIANGKMSLQQPASGPYGATALGGTNSEATLGLIVGNEVNANGLTAAESAQLTFFFRIPS